MTTWARSLILTLGLGAGLGSSFPGAAHADARDEARALATAGVEHFRSGRHAEAIESLRRAEALFHAPTHQLYIARAERARGRPVEAHAVYVGILLEKLPDYAPDAFKNAQREAGLEEAALRSEIATITVERAEGVRIVAATLDGRDLPVARLALPVGVTEGDHVLEITRDPGGPSVFELSVDAGQSRVARVTAPLAEAQPPPRQGSGDTSRPLLIGGFIGLGLGGAALLTGTVTGAVTLVKAGDVRDRCQGDTCPPAVEDDLSEARALGHASTALVVVGGALAATGVALIVVDLVAAGSADGRVSARLSPLGGTVRWAF